MNKMRYIEELVARMEDDSPSGIWGESKAFRACREVEELHDKDLMDIAINMTANEKNKHKRRNLYFVIAKIAKNINSTDVAGFLISQIQKEKDKYGLAALLEGIKEVRKLADVDISPIIELTKNKRWLVRRTAIESLDKTENELAENVLIDILNTNNNPGDIVSANVTLNSIGTEKSIASIEKNLKSRKRDVKVSAEEAIKEIRKRGKIGSRGK
jgi:hypothetical protein